MWFYIVRRFNLFVLTVAVLYFLVFLMINAMPGELATNISGHVNPSVEQHEQLVQQYQLDKNWFNQYISFINQRIHGDFGLSFTTAQPIFDEMLKVLPATIELCFYALLVALCLGLPMGILGAVRYRKFSDHTVLGISLIGYSIPVFWLAMLAIMYFGLKLQWLPVAGRLNLLYQVDAITGFTFIDILLSDIENKRLALRDAFSHLLMPALTLALLPTTVVARIMRTAMLEELNANYIKASQARGLSPATIIFRHALPNAIQPVLAQVSLQLSTILTSAMVIEVIFSWPGIGNWLMDAIYQRDYPVISAGILVCAGFIILVSVLSDIFLIATTPQRRSAVYGSS
ncbi:ABC transporter permease subunit [Psychrobium sp. 1_MG-2023]|uniref:ABC transporter permease n=1 Tax=Psychrobium sp. 1_MG-2023 TaxID=3062624 RepID=UPI000C32C823|nr:ABC transporter permease subunit [Psychrobium sp. 1_MG-2023]MDP2562429.1 ABC transporter permease subunit [Psychrobium sp. 1_MG-2023]PKF56157.1 peptide ABC transporter permease [Alteromonadales bacterium alter-6D02]